MRGNQSRNTDEDFARMQDLIRKIKKSLPIGIHEGETQRVELKPILRKLLTNRIICRHCGKEISIKGLPRLKLCPCFHCGEMIFIPARIKDYWLYEPIGHGGNGRVFHAFWNKDPDVELAVKIMARDEKNDPDCIKEFLREAENGKKFGTHRHLSQIYDYGFDGKEYYMAMEYIEGERLDQIIEADVEIPLKNILLWSMQILAAEQHIYECGYLFRDLKPQNIIIDQNCNARLVDYGLAIPVKEAKFARNDYIDGSPHYLPPERIIGEPESCASEIYSLGMVMFHLLARRPYFKASEVKELIGKHVMALRVMNVGPKLPAGTDPELISIINKMIRRDPGSRFQNFKETATCLFKLFQKIAA